MKIHVDSRALARTLLASTLLALSSCSNPQSAERDTESGSPKYVLGNEIYSAEGSTSYLNVLDSLDIEGLDEKLAVEYSGGRATFATYNGWLFVASPEEPLLTRFSIDDRGNLSKEAELSFANYGVTSLTIDEWSINFIDEHKSYIVNYDDGGTIIVDPTSMEITGEIPAPDLAPREGWSLNGGTGFVRDGKLFRTVFWSNWDSYDTSREQFLAVYDTERDELLELIPEPRCPGLGNRVSQDAQGYLYFSNWIWNVTETLTKDAPESCALRIAPGDDRFDPDWVLRFPELTEGRQGAMLNVLATGQALLSVFHDERVDIDEQTDPSELAGTDNWRIWSVDLQRQSAQPVPGLDWMAGAASNFDIDGRSLVFVPGKEWSITHVYELDEEQARPRFDVTGWSFQLAKVR